MRYHRKELVSEKIEDNLVVLDHETSRVIKLNQTACFVWKLLKKPLTLKEIMQRVCSSYSGVSLGDVKPLLNTLVKEKIAELVK